MIERRRARQVVLALAACVLGQPALARLDAADEALLDAGQHVELEARARARLQAQPDDPQGTLALAYALVLRGDAAALEAGIRQAEACSRRHPAAASCQVALGNLLSGQITGASMFKALGLAPRLRDAFARAVELDPLDHDARWGLQQFYLSAPGVAGGSVDKARELAVQAQARQPEHAKLLRARVAMHEGQWAQAEHELAAVRVGEDPVLGRSLRMTLGALGNGYLRVPDLAKAGASFERIQSEFPQHALGPYGLGRVLTDRGAFDQAIEILERSRGLQGAAKLPIDYRQALAWLGKGAKTRARPLLERFVGQGRGHPANLEDARKRLAELG